MRRVHGPYRHGAKWLVIFVNEDGTRSRGTYDSREEAQEAMNAEYSHLRSETLATLLAATAQRMPELPVWVYFLHDVDGDTIYVGISGSVSHRLAAHRLEKSAVGFSHASFIPTPMTRLDARRVEAALVRELKPRLNLLLINSGNFLKNEVPSADSAVDVGMMEPPKSDGAINV